MRMADGTNPGGRAEEPGELVVEAFSEQVRQERTVVEHDRPARFEESGQPFGAAAALAGKRDREIEGIGVRQGRRRVALM